MIQRANEAPSKMGLTNLSYVCADASSMPEDWTDTFDYAFIHETLHDMPRADLVMSQLRRVMKRGAFLSVIDPNLCTKHADNIAIPYAALWYTSSLFYCLPLASNQPDSLALGGGWGRERAMRLFEDSGFEVLSVDTRDPLHEDLAHYWCRLKL